MLRLLRAGVDGYVAKSTFGPDLPNLVAEVAAGGKPVSPHVAGYLLNERYGETAGNRPVDDFLQDVLGDS